VLRDISLRGKSLWRLCSNHFLLSTLTPRLLYGLAHRKLSCRFCLAQTHARATHFFCLVCFLVCLLRLGKKNRSLNDTLLLYLLHIFITFHNNLFQVSF